MPIDTREVIGRRKLAFERLDDILADVEKLAAGETTALGNWSPGQVFMHLARFMDMSLDGHAPAPWLLRTVVQLFFRKTWLKKPMRPGFKLPAKFQDLQPGDVEPEAGVQSLRGAIRRLQSTSERAAHPVLGTLSPSEWDQLHCRHAELHLSFLQPANF